MEASDTRSTTASPGAERPGRERPSAGALAADRRRPEGRTLGDVWADLEREMALLEESLDALFGRER